MNLSFESSRQRKVLPRTRSIVIGLLAATLSTGVSAHDHDSSAKTCYVDKIKYSNHGGYSVVGLNLEYVKANGNKWSYDYAYYSSLNNVINNGQSLSVDLNHFNGLETEGTVTGGTYPPLKDGDEVWITIPITMGDTPSCHKDGHKLVYKKDVNKTMKFKSSGTTLNDNRCKADGDMDDMCYTGE